MQLAALELADPTSVWRPAFLDVLSRWAAKAKAWWRTDLLDLDAASAPTTAIERAAAQSVVALELAIDDIIRSYRLGRDEVRLGATPLDLTISAFAPPTTPPVTAATVARDHSERRSERSTGRRSRVSIPSITGLDISGLALVPA